MHQAGQEYLSGGRARRRFGGEIATVGRDVTRGYWMPGGVLPPTDEILQAKGFGNHRIYDDLYRDERVASALQQRRLVMSSFPWEVVPGGQASRDEEAAVFMRAELERIKLVDTAKKLHFGVFYGYAVAEMLLARDGARVIARRAVVKKQRRFGFDVKGRLRLLTRESPQGEIMPDKKFWTLSSGGDNDDDPYGLGLGHFLYWPVFFKAGGVKSWSLFIDRLADPFKKAVKPPGLSEQDEADLLAYMEGLRSHSSIILPPGAELEFIQAARSSSGDHEAWVKLWNRAIAMVVIGQALTMENEGGQHKADIQEGILERLAASDADMIADSWNDGPGAWLTAWNFPDVEQPRLQFVTEPPEDLNQRADRDNKIFKLGFKPTQDYIRGTYGDGWEERRATPPGGDPPGKPRPPGEADAAFAEGEEKTDPVAAFTHRLTAEAAADLDDLADALKKALGDIDGWDGIDAAFAEAAAKAFPKKDPLARRIQWALAAADLAGQFEAKENVGLKPVAPAFAEFAEVQYGALRFEEAVDHFRAKLNLPSTAWHDLWQGEHARAFVVAGATRTELLTDLRRAVDKAIADGVSFEAFRDDFDDIVADHGWNPRGGRAWRAETIFRTNLATAHAAGRYKQLTDPDVVAERPFWLYRHGGSKVPRPHHLAWDGLVLRWDDPWWREHYPPNGWGCSCKIFALSEDDLAELGKSGPDIAPDDGTYEAAHPGTGEVLTIPKGVDKGWAYNVGEAAWGRPLAENVMQAWRAEKAGAWEILTQGDWMTEGGGGRPQRVPLDKPLAPLAKPAADAAGAAAVIEEALGGKRKVLDLEADDFRYPVLVDAEALGAHVDPARAAYLPLIGETLDDPFEIWLSFQRHKGTGKVELRTRAIKAFDLGKSRGFIVVLQAVNGVLEAWTAFPNRKLNNLNHQRFGRLLYGRDDG